MPRRRSKHNLNAGADGAAPAVSDTGAAKSEVGQVTLDALMLTYFSAPPGTLGPSSWIINESYATTFCLESLASPALSLKGSVEVGNERFGQPDFKQFSSGIVKDGITLRRDLISGETESIVALVSGIADNTVVYGLRRPRLQFEGNDTVLRFRFLEAESIFLFGVSALQGGDSLVRDSFKSGTLNSLIAQSATDPGAFIEPRFGLRAVLSLESGIRRIFTFSERGNIANPKAVTGFTTAEIVERTGFNSPAIKRAFETGSELKLIFHSSQEFVSDEIIRVETSFERVVPGVIKVYWDRVFKCFIFADAGRPIACTGQPVVEGKVTDTNGLTIEGALVKLRQNDTDYAALTDARGNYKIATPAGELLESGVWPIKCGNVSRKVHVLGGAARQDFAGVDLDLAQQLRFGSASLREYR